MQLHKFIIKLLVKITTNRYVAKFGFGGVLFQGKWTLSCAFAEKLGFFTGIWEKKNFCVLFFEKVDFFTCPKHVRGMFPRKMWKNRIENNAFRAIMI